MTNLQWIFDGIGSEILGLAVGAIVGGITGYRVGVRKNTKQIQKAKSGANQRQELVVDDPVMVGDKSSVQNNIRQTQKAGKNSDQIQVGRISDGKR